MKKIFTVIVALMATVGAFAQQPVGTLSIAPKAGINLADMTGAKNNKMRVGFTGGVDLTYQTSEKSSISGGLFYSQQGMKSDKPYSVIDDDVYGTVDATVKNDYFSVPLFANYYVCPGLALKVGLQFGALLSSKTGGNIKVTDGYNSAEGTRYNDTKEAYNSFDFGVPVGISYEIQGFIVDARYNIGVVNALKDFNGKNSVFTLTLGYKINL